jgi:hypothetical protein
MRAASQVASVDPPHQMEALDLSPQLAASVPLDSPRSNTVTKSKSLNDEFGRYLNLLDLLRRPFKPTF